MSEVSGSVVAGDTGRKRGSGWEREAELRSKGGEEAGEGDVLRES